MIPRVAFVLVLCSVAAALAVAAAGEGRFDRLPDQPYFPPELSRLDGVECSPDGELQQVASAAASEAIVDDFEAAWFSSHLRAAQELPLSRPADHGAASRRSLRFLWLRSFHAPLVIRVDEISPGALRLTAKMLSGSGGYGPGRIRSVVERDLSSQEIAQFDRASAHVENTVPLTCAHGSDGARWIVEVRRNGDYTLINRWTPSSGPVRELGVLLIGFTGWEVGRIY